MRRICGNWSHVEVARTDTAVLGALPSGRMALKAICIDDAQNVHLLIGLNRKNIEDLLRGETLTFPRGVPLTDESEIAIVFAETDEELVEKRLPPPADLASNTPQ